MPKIGRKVKIFSALEVANICGVVNQTAINWIKNGYLKAFTTPGGQYRIYAKDLAAFLDNRGMADSGDVLQVLLERANWGSLLIAADEAVNNRLYNELEKALPGFSIVQVVDSFDLGLCLAREKPGIIILDENLPGLNRSKILRLLKADPVFGKPFILYIGDAGDSSDLADRVFPQPPDSEAIYKAIMSLEKQTEVSA